MIAPETLWHSLERHAAERPNKSALSDEQGSISYADLPAEIQRRAEHLRAVGCRCALEGVLELGNRLTDVVAVPRPVE